MCAPFRDNFPIDDNVEAPRENEKEVVVGSSLTNDRFASPDLHHLDQTSQFFSQNCVARDQLLGFECVNQ